MQKNKRLAFLGLGVMGAPMAGHLANAGFDVTVYNRNPSKAKAWLERYPGTQAETPALASKDADLVLACVGNDADVREVTLAEHGAFSGMKSGAVFVDHTTASAELARSLERQATTRGLGFLDAPVSGGQVGAESGQLTIMVGGEPDVYRETESILTIYAKALTLMGPAGSGQLTKMVNQICIAGLLQALSEGLSFAQAAGLDGEKVLSVIQHGAAQSWQMDNRAQTMLQDEYDFGFAVDWMRKDLNICLTEARHVGARLPVTALIDQFYAQLQQQQAGRLDTSSLMRLLKPQ